MSEEEVKVNPEPVNPERQKQWNDIHTEISKVTDRLGKPIDTGIFDTVVAFNTFGISTVGSCEGHLDHGVAGPWIDFEFRTDEEEKLWEEIDTVNNEIDKLDDEDSENAILANLYDRSHMLKKQIEILKVQESSKVTKLLDEFYQDRLGSIAYDQILVLENRRLESIGTKRQVALDETTQDTNLKRYREEMEAFTQFMKKKFMSS